MTRLNNKIRSLIFFFLLLGAGCSNEIDTLSSASATATESVSPTYEYTSTSVLIPTDTATAIPDPFVRKCVDLGEIELPPPVETTNHWLVLRGDQPPYLPRLINLANGIINLPPNSNVIKLYVSPDQQRLAYDTYTDSAPISDRIVVTDAKGRFIKDVFWESDWTAFWGWLDNNHLMVTKKAPEGEQVPSLIILNLSDGSSREFRSSYPDLDKINYLPWQHNRIVYSPSLSFAIYPSDNGNAITLLRVVDTMELAKIASDVTQTRQPVWSPDGNYVAVAGTSPSDKDSQEIYVLDMQGNIIRITHFTDKYSGVQVGNASWSPNGRYISFWVRLLDSEYEELAVFDLDATVVISYCVPGFNNLIGNSPKPIWSPDNRLIVVNSRESREKPEKVIWVDITNNQGAIMDTGVSVDGWLNSP